MLRSLLILLALSAPAQASTIASEYDYSANPMILLPGANCGFDVCDYAGQAMGAQVLTDGGAIAYIGGPAGGVVAGATKMTFDPLGNVIAWSFSGGAGSSYDTYAWISDSQNGDTFVRGYFYANNYFGASYWAPPGTWSPTFAAAPLAAVPLPATLPLLAAGLTLIGWLIRKTTPKIAVGVGA